MREYIQTFIYRELQSRFPKADTQEKRTPRSSEEIAILRIKQLQFIRHNISTVFRPGLAHGAEE